MDDDSCVMKYIEIVPRDDNRICSDSLDDKFNPLHIKVCDQFSFFLILSLHNYIFI